MAQLFCEFPVHSRYIRLIQILLRISVNLYYSLLVVFHTLRLADALHRITVVVRKTFRMEEVFPRMCPFHLIHKMRKEDNLLIAFESVEIGHYSVFALVPVVCNDADSLLVVDD